MFSFSDRTKKFVFPVLLAGLFFQSKNSLAQYAEPYEHKVTRILFLLDGSGSMKEEWDGKSKLAISKNLIMNMVDSIQRANPNIEFALRVFGHQYPRAEHNCKDSKLEAAFSKSNSVNIRKALDAIKPQGYTPIAYSLFMAAGDFPADPQSKNAIILVTDGLETCDGDICANGSQLQNKRISLRPFVIGLGLGTDKEKYFECVGTYYDATSEVSFQKILNTVISQALNSTTVQINLLNEFGKATETDLEISIYDSHSGKMLYNFVHTKDDLGNPDTLKLDPVGKYVMKVHSIPETKKEDIELTPGKHNVIAVSVPRGMLKLTEEAGFKNPSIIQCIVRKSGDSKTLFVQDFNTTQKYLTGKYDLEILTLPRIYHKGVEIRQSQSTDILIANPGTLTIITDKNCIAGIYAVNAGQYLRVYEFKKVKPKEALVLQPGKYVLISKQADSANPVPTRIDEFQISSGITTTLRL